MGAAPQLVYQWRWTSAPGAGRAVAGLARGIERFDTLSGARVGAQAVYDHGQWRVLFRRALATRDTASEVQFATPRAPSVAFFAWACGNGAAVNRWDGRRPVFSAPPNSSRSGEVRCPVLMTFSYFAP